MSADRKDLKMMSKNEFEKLVQAWMQYHPLPKPILQMQEDGSHLAIGYHSIAICEAGRRLGGQEVDAIVINCDDDHKLAKISAEIDALLNQMLLNPTSEFADGQHRLDDLLNKYRWN